MRKIGVLAFLALLLFSIGSAQPASYTKLKADAEREYAEKSFSRAHDLYEQAAKVAPESEKRWVAFRLAETALREAAAAEEELPADAQQSLAELIAKTAHDDVWVAANETLAEVTRDAQWFRGALDYWAGSSDLPRARRHYLDLVWKWVGEENEIWSVPRDVLVSAVQIAEEPQDRARARYILARQYLATGQPADRERALELLEEIAAIGRKSELYDDALFLLASSQGNDYARALELYRRILREFKAGESEFRDDAEQQIASILAVNLQASVSGTFVPESEQELYLAWRNVKQIELTVRSVDLTKVNRAQYREWMDELPADGAVVRRWTYDTNDSGEHIPGSARVPIEPKLPIGAYVLTARGEKETSKQFLLVTDAHIVVHSGMEHVDVFVSDVSTGQPIPNARVHVVHQTDRENKYVTTDGQTNADGLMHVKRVAGTGPMLVTVAAGARQAFHQTWSSWYTGRDTTAQWRIYAFTDRPAYRPKETVQWKMIARVREREQWTTPANAQLDYFITTPRGEKIVKGAATLNAFGSFWGELPLTDSMPLGIYTITFHERGNENGFRGSAQLFRLEEYKLPEFQVKVDTPEGKQYRLGDQIEATIEATYYFGGPVANATVEAVVYQQPFYRWWYPWRRYDWYYAPPMPDNGGTIISRQTLTTDASGRAILRIDTPRDGVDSTYRIEARVVDASRREVRGEGNVRVMRQRYSVMAVAEHHVHRPGDSVSVDFKAIDANDKPVQTTGTVKVVRRQWKKRYVDEEVLTTKLTTNAKGEATLTFTPKTTGYYAIQWRSDDGPRARDVVTTETAVWVTDRATTELGYHASGLDLILDKDTVRLGETASLIVVTPASGRWVVFSTGADDLLDTQVIHMDGTAKLVQIPIAQQHVPNFFVTASTVFERTFAVDSERIVVPPVDQFLDVEVKSDREEYQPRDEGTVTITTRDASGKPVAAEVSLAVSDEAVTAIQQDTSGDPRAFFYGDTRGNPIVASAGLQSQQYVKLEERKEVEAKEEDQARDGRRRNDEGYFAYDRAAVSEAITVTGQAAKMAMPAPPPPPAPAAVPAPMEVNAQAANVPQGIEVTVRSDFRSTAFWKPDVVTDAGGKATVKIAYPEALTTWRATARAATTGAQFGMSSSTARTSMPLLVRLQGPRFFVAGDRVVVSAVMNNNTDEALSVNASLEAKGLSGGENVVAVRIEPHGEARADWTVTAATPGTANLRVTARGDKYGDAMERAFVVYEHGIDKLIAQSGKVRGNEAVIKLDLPRERRATDLTVQVAPSIAVTMLDALPYLVEFPYGCTEQTMSRFLPAAIVARTVEKLGLGRARIAGKNLDAVTAAGIARLYDMQHDNGAWGWWKEGSDDAWMTAYVVWGFSIARDAGLKIDASRIDRAAAWLDTQLVEHQTNVNDQAWMLHAMSAWRNTAPDNARRAFDNVYKNREKLTPYSRALLALTAHRWRDADRARVLLRNLEDGVQIDRSGETAESMQTAHWGVTNRFWWRWYESPVETTSFALQAFVNIDPENKLVEPIMNWLVKNRRGTRWNNTRDTAIALLAMNDYLQKSGELAGDVSYEVTVNGKVIATKTIAAKDVLNAPSRFSVDPAILNDAAQEIRIRRTSGKAPLYFAAEARFVSLEEPVKAAGNEMFVKREYFRLAPRPTLLKGVQYDRVPLRDNDSIASGERVEVLVTVETKNDYDYLLLEDLKPGGFEAVSLQSGYSLVATSARNSVGVYQELRDRKVAMFIDHLDQGTWEIRYELRAEVPGTFHALPLMGQAFYVPDVRANSDEVRVTVRE